MSENPFAARFRELVGTEPMSWQSRMYHDHFATGDLSQLKVIDLPTGLGKTMVMAIWLIARRFFQPLRLLNAHDSHFDLGITRFFLQRTRAVNTPRKRDGFPMQTRLAELESRSVFYLILFNHKHNVVGASRIQFPCSAEHGLIEARFFQRFRLRTS